ncbi:MAG: DUF2065 domain-containing protein [Gammaproteobacteria bacterium]|nr:DUF2065 domain-containing protein [Gammaproteobacteria bacterium]
MDWKDLIVALALVLVIEGFMPFINPTGLKRTMAMIIAMPEKTLRVLGFISMITGVLLLYWVR